MRTLLAPALLLVSAACSVYGAPGAEADGAGGQSSDVGPVPSAGGGGAGVSSDLGGSATGTSAGSSGDPLDADITETTVIDEPSSAPIEAATEASPIATCAGFALQLSGFSYVRVNRPVQDDFTIEAWMKSSTPSLTGTHHWEGSGLLWADVSGNHDDFGASVLNNKLAFGVGNPGALEPTIVSTTVVVSGQWTHVAATRTKSTGEIKLFVNGAQEASMVVATETRSLTAQINMTFGADVFDNRFFVGTIDEVRAWNVVRTAADITATMHQKLKGDEAGLVGYWRFDEGSGTSTADSTATKNNGDVFGNPNWVPSDAPICP